MFIVLQDPGDPMILDSVEGHRRTFHRIKYFLQSTSTEMEIPAAGKCHLCPDWPTLEWLRFLKTEQRIHIERLPRGIQLSGRVDHLSRCAMAFLFVDGPGHHHVDLYAEPWLDPRSNSVIVEADGTLEDEQPQVVQRAEGVEHQAIELHDSTIEAIGWSGTDLVVRMNAYVHSSLGTPGWDAGRGWYQDAQLIIAQASMEQSESGVFEIDDGTVRVGLRFFDNVVPVPLISDGDVELELTGEGGDLRARGTSVSLSVSGEPGPVEEFSPRQGA